MRQKSMIMQILLLIGIFFAASILLSTILTIFGGLFWILLKVLLPVAIAVWIVRIISRPSKRNRRYF